MLRVPIAHGEGNYFADAETLRGLNRNRQILLKYCSRTGALENDSNWNGSAESIAGICNVERNVFGLMPHPERACDARLGSVDGLGIFESILTTLGMRAAA